MGDNCNDDCFESVLGTTIVFSCCYVYNDGQTSCFGV